MEQPSVITIKEEAIGRLKCYGLVATEEYETRIQLREPDDDSKIVYILNLKHVPTDRNSNQWVALTEKEYNVVETVNNPE
jgi:hypothetical protein